MKRTLLNVCLAAVPLAVGGEGLPVPIVWQVNAKTLARRQYIKDIDYLRAHTAADILSPAPVEGTVQGDMDQMRAPMRELAAYARAKGFRVALRTDYSTPGFFAAPAFPSAHGLSVKGPLPNIIKDQAQAQALTVDVEGRLDGTGYACLRSEAKWNREKIIPLYAKPLAAYVFEKAGAGFYKPGSLEDVSARMRVVAQDNRSMSVELDLGAPYAGKDVFLLAGHFFNALEIYEAQYADFQKTFDGFADAALDGAVNDEQGFMPVDAWGGEPFRGRYFSFAGERYWREALKTDFRRLLFDMRYAPAGDAAVRIRAINRYFDEARRVTMAFEDAVADYQLARYSDPFLACHSTYHNSLDSDDFVKNTCNYWSLPRDYGFTDEGTIWPIRLGVLLGSKMKFGYNMFYSKNPDDVYGNIIDCAPWRIREFHHAYNDGRWGLGYTEQPFTANVKKLDEAVRLLDGFQRRGALPRTDVLLVFGEFAHANWYPDEKARGKWDQNASLRIMEKAQEAWRAGHVAALLPDRLVEEGRLRFEDGAFALYPIARTTACDRRAAFNAPPARFRKLVFLYPRYAKRCVWDFLNGAAAKGAALVVVGPADLDVNAEKASFAGRRVAEWDLAKIAAELQLASSRIPGGCVYEDGSFALVSDAILTGRPTKIDLAIDGRRFTGHHTGVLAFRKGEALVATVGSKLFCDGQDVGTPRPDRP